MAYGRGGSGKARFLKDIGVERAGEQALFEKQLTRAEDAYRKDQERSSAYEFGAGTIGAIIALATQQDPAKGFAVGKEFGDWGARFTSDYKPSKYYVSTETGKFDVSQKYGLEDVNRQFDKAYSSDFYRDVTGTGETLLSLWGSTLDLDYDEWKTNEQRYGREVRDRARRGEYRKTGFEMLGDTELGLDV